MQEKEARAIAKDSNIQEQAKQIQMLTVTIESKEKEQLVKENGHKNEIREFEKDVPKLFEDD